MRRVSWPRFRTDLLAGVLVLAPLGLTAWVFFGLVGVADGLIRLLPAAARPEITRFPIPGSRALGALARPHHGTHHAVRRWPDRTSGGTRRCSGASPFCRASTKGSSSWSTRCSPSAVSTFARWSSLSIRGGIYCLAFVTNEDPYLAVEGADPRLISIFLPTTPNPTSGFYLLVPAQELRKVNMTSEEAFKLIMSAGIVTPGGHRVANSWVGFTNPGTDPNV